MIPALAECAYGHKVSDYEMHGVFLQLHIINHSIPPFQSDIYVRQKM